MPPPHPGVHPIEKFIKIEHVDELNEQVAAVLHGLGFGVTSTQATGTDGRAELTVSLPTETGETVAVDVRHRPTMSPVEIEKWRSEHPDGAILGYDYVSPSFARRLQAAGINYVDSAGNAYIRRPGLHVHIEGRRVKRPASLPVGHHLPAPGPASLRVIFALLVKPDLAGATFDELAAMAGVAKGTVHNTLHDLTLRGHLTGRRRDRRLIDISRLAELWVDGFATQLLPRLGQRALAGPGPEWWTEHARSSSDITLGGGLALAHYGGRLRPDMTIIYGPKPWAAARKLGRLTSQGDPNVLLRERFWSPRLLPDAQFAHPLLAYADALSSGESREIEIARELGIPRLSPE